MKTELMQAAVSYTNAFRERARNLKNTIRDLEFKATEAKAHLDATDLAIQRLDSFRVTVGGELQCPRCWINHGASAPLIPQPSDTDDDWFKCRACDFEFESPA